MNLIGKKILLRSIERDDNEFLRAMLNDPDMEHNVIGWSFPVSKAAQEAWFEKQLGDNNNHRFIIEYQNKPVGLATLTKIDWKNRKATHGVKLYSDDVKGKGIAKEAVRLVMKYAFEELQLNRLDGSILEYNISSQKLYEKCAWRVEGVTRQSIFKGNKYIDEIQVGALREDYEKVKSEW